MTAVRTELRTAPGRSRVWAAHEWQLLVGGELTGAASGLRRPTVSPSTEEVLAEVPVAGAEDVAAAVDRGAAAQRAWARVPVRDRAAAVRAVAGVLREHAGELAMLDAFDGGHPVSAMRADVEPAAAMIELVADLAAAVGPSHPRRRFGVVARIVPGHHPVTFTASRLAAPLMAGNAVVVQAPDRAPLSALRLGELLVGVLPDGLVSVLSGDGATTGAAIAAHPAIRRIAFHGTGPTGRAVRRGGGEVGTTRALVVRADADPAAAAAEAVRGMTVHGTVGRSYGSAGRLLVHESRYAEVVGRVAAEAAAVRVGDPLVATTEMGPLITAAHRDRVRDHVRAAVRDGGRLVTGGAPPEGPGFMRGFWMSPTVIAGVDPGRRLARAEVVGPVLTVLPFRDERERP